MLVHFSQQLLATLGIAALAGLVVGSYALYERRQRRAKRDLTKR
jgi:hypothetical protein